MRTLLSSLLAIVLVMQSSRTQLSNPQPAMAKTPTPIEVSVETTTQKLQLQASDSFISVNSQVLKTDLSVEVIRRIQSTDRKDLVLTLSDGTVLRGELPAKMLRFNDRGRRVDIPVGQLKDANFSSPAFSRPPGKELILRTRAGESLRAVIPSGELSVRTKEGKITRPWLEVKGVSFFGTGQASVTTTTGEELKGMVEGLEFEVMIGDRKIPIKPASRLLETISTAEIHVPAPVPTIHQSNGQTLMLVRIKSEAAWTEIETLRMPWTIEKVEVTEGKASIDSTATSRAQPAIRITTETTPATIDVTVRIVGVVPETTPLTIKKSNRGNVRVEINPDKTQRATQWIESQGGSPPEGRTFDIRP